MENCETGRRGQGRLTKEIVCVKNYLMLIPIHSMQWSNLRERVFWIGFEAWEFRIFQPLDGRSNLPECQKGVGGFSPRPHHHIVDFSRFIVSQYERYNFIERCLVVNLTVEV